MVAQDLVFCLSASSSEGFKRALKIIEESLSVLAYMGSFSNVPQCQNVRRLSAEEKYGTLSIYSSHEHGMTNRLRVPRKATQSYLTRRARTSLSR